MQLKDDDVTGRRATEPATSVLRGAWGAMLLAGLMLASCAKVIGAEFSDLLPLPPGSGGAGGDGARTEGDASDDVDQPIADDVVVVPSDAEVDAAEGAPVDSGRPPGPDAGTDARDALRDAEASVPTPEPESEAGPRDARSDVVEATTPTEGGALGDGTAAGVVLINEVNAFGSLEDFIELYNVGGAPLDLAGYAVAQAEQSYGPPNYASRLIFAAGTRLGAGERVLIVANQLVRGGPSTPCEVPRFTAGPCYTVEWGISRAGERVYLLAPDLTVIDSADFPAVDAGQPESGRSWGRFPDGAGPFQSTVYSPDAPNRLQ